MPPSQYMEVMTILSRNRKTILGLMKVRVRKEPGPSTSEVSDNARNSQNLRIIPANLPAQALDINYIVVH